jgi:hypothetical protein
VGAEDDTPLLASSVSNRLRPFCCCAASAALRAREASSSVCAASQASERSMGASIVPPEMKPEDILGGGRLLLGLGREREEMGGLIFDIWRSIVD